MWLNKIIKSETGSIAVLAAVSFVVVAAVCGLVVDLGAVYMRGSQLQNAADASVYAAVYDLPVATSDSDAIALIKSKVRTYAQRNGIDSECVESITFGDVINGQYTTIRTQLEDNVMYGFGPIVGLKGAVVTKAAKIGVRAATSANNMLPLGTTVEQFEAALADNGAQDVVVKYGAGDAETGFFGALDLDGVQGGGAKDFATWLAFGYDGTLDIGDSLPTENGNMTGPTTSAFETRYNSCTHFATSGGCSEAQFVETCERVVVLIIYSMDGVHDIIIEAFVPFVLVGNSGGEITASHINITVNSGNSEELDADNMKNGMFVGRLIE